MLINYIIINLNLSYSYIDLTFCETLLLLKLFIVFFFNLYWSSVDDKNIWGRYSSGNVDTAFIQYVNPNLFCSALFADKIKSALSLHFMK